MSMPMRSDALQIESLGEHARRFLRTHRKATVAAVFERSLYLEHDGDFVCLGMPGIGNGPINAIVGAEGADADWIRGLQIGQHVVIRECVVHAGRWHADFSNAARWHTPPWPPAAPQIAQAAALARVDALARDIIPDEGLAPIVFARPQEKQIAAPFARIAAPRVARFAAWLADRIAGRSTEGDGPPIDLLGLGPGLTPSGDDLLGCVLIVLAAIEAHAAKAELARRILIEGPRATTPLSACFLAAAAEGLGSEVLHVFIAALISGDLDALPASILALSRIGHTSGWDALAGAVLALRACVARQAIPARRSP